MPDTHPYTQRKEVVVPALATDAEDTTTLFEAPFALTLTAASYVPDTAITGAATNNRKVAVVNKGAAGAGTTEMASLTFDDGVDGVAFDEKALTLSGTAANLNAAAGDIIAWASTAPGSGLADPGGTVIVEYSRA